MRLAREFPNMEYFKQPRNMGSKANGIFLLSLVEMPYTMFLGAHDYLSNTYVKTLKALLDENPDAVLAGGRNVPFRRDGGPCPTSDIIPSGFLDSHCAFNRVEFLAKDGLNKDGCFIGYGLQRTDILRKCFDEQSSACGCDLLFLAREAAIGKILISDEAEYYSETRIGDTQNGYFHRITARDLDEKDMQEEMVRYAKCMYSTVKQVTKTKHLITFRPFIIRLYLSIKYGAFKRESIFDFAPYMATYLAEKCFCNPRQAPGSDSIHESFI
jgi:hypothetical protein